MSTIVCECGNKSSSYLFLPCESCDRKIYLSCSDEIILCDSCKTVHEVALEEQRFIKCGKYDCQERAIINQLCHGSCNVTINRCAKHLHYCEICNSIICQECNVVCTEHATRCDGCNLDFRSDKATKCDFCTTLYCTKCKDFRFHKGITSKAKLCENHRNDLCNQCYSGKYRLPFFKCQFESCWDYACAHYSCFDGKRALCHRHMERCTMCLSFYPLNERHVLKIFNNRLTCTKCFNVILMSIYCIKLFAKENNLIIPKDIIIMLIFHIVKSYKC